MTTWWSAGRILGIVAVGAVAGATALWAGPTTRTVDCARKSLQEAIDGADEGDTIAIDGICAGSYRIVGKQLTLRAANAAGPDRLAGAPGAGASPLLAVSHSPGLRIENLTISASEGTGLAVVASTVTLEDVRIAYHDVDGLHADGASLVDGLRVAIFGSGRAALRAEAGSRIVCTECDVSGAFEHAVDARDGARIVLHDSSVIADRALYAVEGGSATLDCVEAVSSHDCFLNASRSAAAAEFGGVVSLRAVGEFSGQITAFDRSEVQLHGARQTDAGAVGVNGIDVASALLVAPIEDENELPLQSRLSERLFVDRFSRVVLESASTLDGEIWCSGGSDAWADSEVIYTGGAAILGCANAAYP